MNHDTSIALKKAQEFYIDSRDGFSTLEEHLYAQILPSLKNKNKNKEIVRISEL